MIEVPKWFTKKPVVSDVEDMIKDSMTRNKKIINGGFIEIMVMVCGVFTGKMVTMSGKKIKERRIMFALLIMKPMQ